MIHGGSDTPASGVSLPLSREIQPHPVLDLGQLSDTALVRAVQRLQEHAIPMAQLLRSRPIGLVEQAQDRGRGVQVGVATDLSVIEETNVPSCRSSNSLSMLVTNQGSNVADP
jgi:hypothetical protein